MLAAAVLSSVHCNGCSRKIKGFLYKNGNIGDNYMYILYKKQLIRKQRCHQASNRLSAPDASHQSVGSSVIMAESIMSCHCWFSEQATANMMHIYQGGYMKSYTITASARLSAPAALVYTIIADYHNGHPHILPKPPFIALQVEHGGIGAGTIINFQMRLFGATQSFRAAITEPQPGKVLVETNMEPGGAITTFLVTPVGQSPHTDVTITTEGRTTHGGMLGILEKLLTTMLLRPIYVRELALLNTLAQQRYTSTAGESYGRTI
jgi:hypothetical protein